jgi:uncharacterized protein YbaR (Trm112 family)
LQKVKKMIDVDLLDILVCPVCKGDVKETNSEIVCTNCGRRYPIKNGIPVMIAEEAREK